MAGRAHDAEAQRGCDHQSSGVRHFSAGMTSLVRISRLRISCAGDRSPPGLSSAAMPTTPSCSRSCPSRSTSAGPVPNATFFSRMSLVRQRRQPLCLALPEIHRARAGASDRRQRDLGLALHVVGDRLARLVVARPSPSAPRRGECGGTRRPGPRARRRATRLGTCRAARQLRNVHAAQADEDRQPHAADARERLRRRGGHAHRRVGPLDRARRDGDVLEAIEPAVVAERLAFPCLQDDLERLEEARLALLVRRRRARRSSRVPPLRPTPKSNRPPLR